MAQILYPNELQTPELVLEFLEYAPHRFLRVPTYHFLLIEPVSKAVAGRINLRVDNSELIALYAGHLGYEVAEAFRGRRLSLHAVEMLKPLARRLDLDPLWITTNPDNTASKRIAELVGGEFIETIAVPPGSLMYEGGSRHKCRYRVSL